MTHLNHLLLAIALFFLPTTAQAQQKTFNWKSIPMQSGEVSNISVSPVNPDIMYLGVQVNAHSAYKSTDRGKSWKRIHTYDHNKDIAVHPTDHSIVILADSQAVWRSSSAGEGNQRTGQGAHGGPPSSFEQVLTNDNPPGPSETSFSTLAAAPSNPNIWYVATRGSDSASIGRGPFGDGKSQLWRSSDTGKTWTKVNGNLPRTILVIAVDPFNENRLMIGSADGIHESKDAGATTERVSKANHVASIHTLDGATWLAASLNGIYLSEDGGRKWSGTDEGLPDERVQRVTFVRDAPKTAWATTYNGVVRSTDGGRTWSDVSGNLPAKNLQALAADPTNPNLALVTTDTFVFSVRSESRLWRPGQYYRQGTYRTEDGGKTWNRSDDGIMEESLLDVTAHPSRPYEVWAAQQSSRGLYRSRDAGQTWSLSPRLLTHYPMRTVFFPGIPDKIAHTSLHTGEDFGITEDSGVNWKTWSEDTFFNALSRGKSLLDKTQRGANLHLHGLAIDPKNPDIIYVGSVDDPSTMNAKAVKGAHVFKSTDGGKTWKESDEGYEHETATSINDIKIDPQNTDIVYIAMTKKESTSGNGVWKSTNAGESWSRFNTGMPDNASVSTLIIHPESTNKLLAATFEGLYASTNAGESWKLVKSGMFKDIEFDPSNPDTVYTGSGPEESLREWPPAGGGINGIFMSTDFGQNWSEITGNLPSGKITTVSVSSDGKIVYAGVDGHGLYAAIDSSVGAIPIDEKTGLEAGNLDRGGMSEYSEKREPEGKHGGHDPQGPGGPYTRGGPGEPPPWPIRIAIMAFGLIMVGGISYRIYRFIRRRNS